MNLIQKICIWIIPVLFAITIHELAHGLVAYRLGDKTGYILKRLTLNPLRHIDPIGTLLVPGILLLLGGFIFGWAKSMPISANNFKRPRLGLALVAIAGPVANLLMVFFWVLCIKLGVILTQTDSSYWSPLIYMGQAGVLINLILGLINLIPIPPLDGGRFISNILPTKFSYYFDKIEPFGFLILLLLLATGILSFTLSPLLFGAQQWLSQLFGL